LGLGFMWEEIKLGIRIKAYVGIRIKAYMWEEIKLGIRIKAGSVP
jgi:hypothetical protein